MNVGVDVRCLMDKNRTGVGEYTYELLNAVFLQDKMNQYYIFYNSNKDVSENIPKWKHENVHYVQTRYPNKVLNLLLFLKFIRLDKIVQQESKKARKQSDFDNLTMEQFNNGTMDFWFSPNLNFTNLSKNVKHIQTIHDLSFEIMSECFTLKQRLWHWFLNPRKQCQRADIILTPSENTKRDVVDRYQIANNKVQLLYPGLSSNFRFQISDFRFSEIKQKYNIPDKYILYLGTLEPRKNVSSVIQAFKQSSLIADHWSLVIAGSKGWKNKEVLEDIENIDRVKYVGYVSEEEKTRLYSGAGLFVYPSLYEGFGLPVLEAMASGVPVITSNRSSLPEVVGESAILVNPYNVEEIAGTMERVLKNEELRLRIIEKQNLQSEKFSWSKTAEEFIKIL